MTMTPADFEGLWKTLPTDDPSSVDLLKRAGMGGAVEHQVVRFANGRTGDPWLDEKTAIGYRIVFPLRDGSGATVGLLVRNIRPRPDVPTYLVAPGSKPGAVLGHPNRTVSAAPVYVTINPFDVLALQIAEVPVVGCYAPEQLGGLPAYLGDVRGKVVYLCSSSVSVVVPGEVTPASAVAELAAVLEDRGAATRILAPQGGAKSIAETARVLGPKAFSWFIHTGQSPSSVRSTASRANPSAPRSIAGAAPAPAPESPPEGDLAPTPEPAAVLAPLNNKARPLTKSYASMCQILRTPTLRQAVLGTGEIEFNEQSLQATIGRKTPIDDFAVNRIRELAEVRFPEKPGSHKGLQFNKGDIEQSVSLVAREKPYHPVADYLNGLTWDRTERLNAMSPDILGVADDAVELQGGSVTPLSEICALLIRKFMISAVARALSPGAKVDTVLILTGPQGSWKSRFFRELASPEWFSDTTIDIHNKDAYMVLRSVWVMEWAELDSMARARDGEAVKAFVSSSSDTFRPPYEKEVRSIPRTSVIVGSSNRADFLTDETGNRRWWPVPVTTEINLALLVQQRNQLWAEAVVAFKSHERHWLEGDEKMGLTALQKRFENRDAWEEMVMSYVQTQESTTVAMIMQGAIQKHPGQWTPGDERRVTRILRRNRFEPKQIQMDGKRVRRWVRTTGAEEMAPPTMPEPPPHSDSDELSNAGAPPEDMFPGQ